MSEIDWTVTWKLFHYQFWCIYLCVGVPSRLFLARRIKTASLGNAVFYAIASSLVASLLSTWFPIIPLAGAILINMAGEAAREYALITVPMVAVLMGLETALVDAIFVRMLLKGSPRVGFRAFLVINTLNATIALALGLAWAHRHMPIFIAALDICC